jgi:hypothetical protein
MVESLNQNTIEIERRAIVSMVVAKLETFEGRKAFGDLNTASTFKQQYCSEGKSVSHFSEYNG